MDNFQPIAPVLALFIKKHFSIQSKILNAQLDFLNELNNQELFLIHTYFTGNGVEFHKDRVTHSNVHEDYYQYTLGKKDGTIYELFYEIHTVKEYDNFTSDFVREYIHQKDFQFCHYSVVDEQGNFLKREISRGEEHDTSLQQFYHFVRYHQLEAKLEQKNNILRKKI